MRSQFVGRGDERARFGEILAARSAAVVYVTGLGGIGKSALLAEFAAAALETGVTSVGLDLDEVVPLQAEFHQAVNSALAEVTGRVLILVDEPPHREALTRWLHQNWRTSLPGDAIVVIASRRAAPLTARIGTQWAAAIHLMPLTGLSSAESRAVLGSNRADGARLSGLARGNPLALTLLAKRPGPLSHLEDDVRLVRELIDGIVEPIPSAVHRRALQVSALVGHTTEDILEAVFDENGQDVFEWLRREAYVTEADGGLVPDELVRTIVDADLRWRDRLAYASLHRQVSRHLRNRLEAELHSLDAVLRTGEELLVLARHRVHLPSGPIGTITRDVYDDLDEPSLPDDIAHHVRMNGDLREDETFAVSRVLDLAALPTVVGTAAFEAHHDPLMAWDFVLVPATQTTGDAADLLALFDLHHIANAAVGSDPVGIFGHDWRRLSPGAWLRKIVDQPWDAAIPPPTGVHRRLLTDEREFTAAVRAALKELRFDRRLAVNPLVDARIVHEASPELAPEHRLRELIRSAAQNLRATDAALFRIIDLVYLRPTTTQQAVAESMHLPFTTFRRWRNKAITLIAKQLWELELGVSEGALTGE